MTVNNEQVYSSTCVDYSQLGEKCTNYNQCFDVLVCNKINTSDQICKK